MIDIVLQFFLVLDVLKSVFVFINLYKCFLEREIYIYIYILMLRSYIVYIFNIHLEYFLYSASICYAEISTIEFYYYC